MTRLIWRKYRQSDIYFKDLDAVVQLHVEQEKALGTVMDLPDFMNKPVLEAWVAERDGVVVGGMYFEAIAECCFFGRDPEVSASARIVAPRILEGFQRRGFRVVRIEVPRWMGRDAKSVGAELIAAGFRSTDGEYDHFVFDMRNGVSAPVETSQAATRLSREDVHVG